MAENLVLTEEYTLPSLGKMYSVELNPEVKLRSMTTNEEMLRLSPSERAYKVIAEIIDDCLLTKLPIKSYDLCIGDFIFLLHKLRITTYGPEYKTVSTCPYCGNSNERTLDLDKLSWNTYSDELKDLFEFKLPVSGNFIKIKAQTPRIIDNISVRSKDLKKQASGNIGDPALLFNVIEVIDTIDGEKPNPLNIEKWVRELPMRDTNYILNHSKAIDERVGLNSKIETECDLCGLTYDSNFRITSEFFGPSISL